MVDAGGQGEAQKLLTAQVEFKIIYIYKNKIKLKNTKQRRGSVYCENRFRF